MAGNTAFRYDDWKDYKKENDQYINNIIAQGEQLEKNGIEIKNGDQIKQDFENHLNSKGGNMNYAYDEMQYKSANNLIEDSWFDRNKEWIYPLLAGLLTFGGTTAVNMFQQDKQNKYNSEQAAITRDYNAQQAQENRNWQELMSNTAITRQVNDLIRAGINPTLGAQLGGSAVTSGAQGSATNASSAGLIPMNMSEMMTAAKTSAEIRNLEANTQKTYKDAGKSESEMKLINLQTGIQEINAGLEQALMRTNNSKMKKEIQIAQKELKRIDQTTDLIKAQKELEQWEARHPVLSKMLPGVSAMVGGALGYAVGGPAGAAAGMTLNNMGKRKIGFNN